MMIYDLLRARASKYSDATAITMGNEHLSYGRVESLSNCIAGMLRKAGIEAGDRVGLYLEKKPLTITAMLGINKAGGVYVPLDTNSPAERVSRIIRDSDLSLLLVDHDSAHFFQQVLLQESFIRDIPWGLLSEEELQMADENPPRFSLPDILDEPDISYDVNRDENTASHILFTSGSTGRPKGVVVTHKNVNTFITWAVSYFGITTGERVSCHSPLHFDLSTFDIYGAFAAASHLYLVPEKINVNPHKLVAFIRDNELNQWFSVPSALSYLAKFKVIPKEGFPHLKRLMWCGEVFPVPALQYWMKNLPDTQFTNLYGPTEATIASSYYTVPEIPKKDEEIPIGTACENEKLLVLNEDFEPVGQGEKGDLYIAGDGLSPGYWRDPEKTNSAFLTHINEGGEAERIYKTGDLATIRDDGLVSFHGRADYQIKSRGYRIELGEIESAMSQINFLMEYAVVPVEMGGFEGTAIGCAYVTGSKKNGTIPPILKKILRAKLPAYMIPHYWKEYEKLPRNGNGKIDRKALSDVFENNKKVRVTS